MNAHTRFRDTKITSNNEDSKRHEIYCTTMAIYENCYISCTVHVPNFLPIAVKS
jgi:hypothetical protein